MKLLEIQVEAWDRMSLLSKICLVVSAFLCQVGFKLSGISSDAIKFNIIRKRN